MTVDGGSAGRGVAGQQATDSAYTVLDITRISLIQRLVPDRLLGRGSATFHTVERGAMLAGLFVGGLLGSWIGLRPTLLVGSVGALVSVAILAASPIRGLLDVESRRSGSTSH